MKCYHCLLVDQASLNYFVEPAVGVCHQCGEAVCERHAVKSDVPLPGELGHGTHPALHPLLCTDCYAEIKALAATPS